MKEAADYLGVSLRTLYKLPIRRTPRGLHGTGIKLSDLNAWRDRPAKAGDLARTGPLVASWQTNG